MTQRQLIGRPHHIGAAVVTLVLALETFPPVAYAGDADWKYYSTSPGTKGSATDLFYDARGLKRNPDGNIEVWVKGLDDAKIQKIMNDPKPDKALVESVAQKVAHYYLLPFGTLHDLANDTYVGLVLAEEVANQASVPPVMQVLYEADCRGGMLRELSVKVYSPNGAVTSSESPMQWSHIPPESPGHSLLALVCPLK
jgi:hypothetical protein